ncbi:hypothetical protein [Nocardia sp. NBC_01388]|uniref:hypothetical protein n=1 Tax=Nocardia sp. NBC_01388 TaxID=2903596 RepID=UPI002F9071BF
MTSGEPTVTSFSAKAREKTRKDFRAACDAWEAVGEPGSGPIFDRVQVTRQAFIDAYETTGEDT